MKLVKNGCQIWVAEHRGPAVFMRTGKAGGKGRLVTRDLKTDEAALRYLDTEVARRLADGYELVDDDAGVDAPFTLDGKRPPSTPTGGLKVFTRHMYGRRADPREIRRLIEIGHDANRPWDVDRWTSLHALLITIGRPPNMDVMQVLVEATTDLDRPDARGWTPLHFAARNGHPPAMALLLERGASVNVVDHKGVTPLHRYIAENPQAVADEVLDLFLAHGAIVTDVLRDLLEVVANFDWDHVRAKLGVTRLR